MPLFLFNRINLHNQFSFITFVLSKLNDRRSIMKERRMKINRNKLERLLAAVAPTIYDINEIPHIKDIPYGSCKWQDRKLNAIKKCTNIEHSWANQGRIFPYEEFLAKELDRCA